MTHFNTMGLPTPILNSLDRLGFSQATPIQTQAIPLALNSLDILGSADTGTGKTFAFLIPVVTKLLNNPDRSALILTPTRELAQQVLASVIDLTGRKSDLHSVLLIGGEPYPKQLSQLKKRPHIVIGTPGRVYDHMTRGTLNLNKLAILVLDETDRMLEMGFDEQIKQIIQQIPEDRQTLMFSATLLPRIEKMAGQYLRSPERISTSPTIKPAAKIKQETINLKESDKFQQLVEQIKNRDGSIIIFVKTKINCERLANNLSNHEAFNDVNNIAAIHGDLRQKRRDQIMRDVRKGKYRVLVATDVAARGLDVPEIRHVINFDLPQCPEDYVHRIGRTGRAGAEGFALNFVAPSDNSKWNAIQRLLDPKQKYDDAPIQLNKRPGGQTQRRGQGSFRDKFRRSEDRFNSDRFAKSERGESHRLGRSSSFQRSESNYAGNKSFGETSRGYKEDNWNKESRFENRNNDGRQRSSFNRSSDGRSSDTTRSGFGFNRDRDNNLRAPRGNSSRSFFNDQSSFDTKRSRPWDSDRKEFSDQRSGNRMSAGRTDTRRSGNERSGNEEISSQRNFASKGKGSFSKEGNFISKDRKFNPNSSAPKKSFGKKRFDKY